MHEVYGKISENVWRFTFRKPDDSRCRAHNAWALWRVSLDGNNWTANGRTTILMGCRGDARTTRRRGSQLSFPRPFGTSMEGLGLWQRLAERRQHSRSRRRTRSCTAQSDGSRITHRQHFLLEKTSLRLLSLDRSSRQCSTRSFLAAATHPVVRGRSCCHFTDGRV
jgi:hypothetical protein